MAGFNPKDKLIRLQGKDYLEVRWRVVWFREVHPTGAITTELVMTEPTVIVKAAVHGGDGVLLASDYGTAPTAGKGTWTGRSVEKATTAAIGRALALAGFGTQFDADDEGDHLADAPIEPPRKAAPANEGGWTSDQFEALKQQAAQLFIAPEHILGVLGVGRIRDYTPGYDRAVEMLKAHAAAREYKQNGGAK